MYSRAVWVAAPPEQLKYYRQPQDVLRVGSLGICFIQSQYKGNHKKLAINKADVLPINKAHVLRLNNRIRQMVSI